MENNGKTIEQIFTDLELVIKRLEDEQSSLEQSFEYYESGMKLIKQCSEKIERVEKQIMVLSEEGGDHDF